MSSLSSIFASNTSNFSLWYVVSLYVLCVSQGGAYFNGGSVDNDVGFHKVTDMYCSTLSSLQPDED